jgi:hypothetical protein
MNKVLLFAVATPLLFTQCKKDVLDTNVPYFGLAKATVNGTPTTFTKVRGFSEPNSFNEYGFSFNIFEGLINKAALSIGPLNPPVMGRKRIAKSTFGSKILTSTYFTLRDDGDVLCDKYNVYEPDSLNNFIDILAYNPQTKEIRGRFQITYLIDSTRLATIGRCRPTTPDTLRIQNGEFYTKLF